MYEDNKLAIYAAKAEVYKMLKHLVKLNYHLIRKIVIEGNVILRWLSTKNQITNSLTKALPENLFKDFRNLIMQNINK